MMTNWSPCGLVIGASLRQFGARKVYAKARPRTTESNRGCRGPEWPCMPRHTRLFFDSCGRTGAHPDRFRAFWAKTAAKAWALFHRFPYDAFPVPPQGGFRGEEWETQFILPAHTDPIHFTVDPGSDTIARG